MKELKINLLQKHLIIAFFLVAFVSCKDKAKKEAVTEDSTAVTEKATSNFGGLALYTVRDDMGTDAKTTLQAVADAGYKNIEAAGYADGKFYGLAPAEFKSLLDDLDLTPVSSHQSSVTLENADAMMADVKAAGFEYFVVPIPPMGMYAHDRGGKGRSLNGTIEDFVKVLNTLGEKANAAGLKLLYHNHDFEFKKNDDGVVIIDYLLDNCNPEFVDFQMDLFWVVTADADPIAYFEKYPGRFKMWHVKDMDDQGRFAPVGNGNIDFAEILAKKELSGMEYYMVEQDKTFDEMKPLEAIKISHEGLKKYGFR
ncbi:sugar phosphate isomerase/epimerase [Aurantibacter crassamenti]|uniref:sugar phosphate isomerase/epimerase family protein n=1 Tax=Aurantibacter crassamenti TaxID=1837375 RepID=UPI001939A381|nr:sugar phosphate isomerase/epimerase [Aurantibacter crassamenti]MBM1105785.1 sugar phosphate isomerase/epimerase [Aurantibacter crassamenti]